MTGLRPSQEKEKESDKAPLHQQLEFRFLLGDYMDDGGESSGESAASCGSEQWDLEDEEDEEVDEDDT
eukprot:CAMPEP_0174888294 /NCGR_PEP_ID=MMETSP0167-20121228/3579_1 /TAXON_ID=38298 /ORGANISM="Rhodella maculata, Strain CCMP736" /LENGTH=67 /DNA_ID=CAMNT_0016125207 /DNA_START=38 /DNA_END=242 /DNA_ORIENTATION=-